MSFLLSALPDDIVDADQLSPRRTAGSLRLLKFFKHVKQELGQCNLAQFILQSFSDPHKAIAVRQLFTDLNQLPDDELVQLARGPFDPPLVDGDDATVATFMREQFTLVTDKLGGPSVAG